MKTIWKFPLRLVNGGQMVSAPPPFAIVRFAMQDGRPCAWAIVNDDLPPKTHGVAIVGTGHECPDDAAYRGSCEDRAFIWHLFERNT